MSLSPRHPHTPAPSTSLSAIHEPSPAHLRAFSAAFPFPSPHAAAASVDLDYLIEYYLPTYEESSRLCNLYLSQAPWFFGAVTQRQLVDEIVPLWYPDAAGSPPPGLGEGALPAQGGAHDLALLFIILCFGAMTDTSLPFPSQQQQQDEGGGGGGGPADSEYYYQLTKAALTVEPVLERPASVATVQTLALMAIYMGLRSGENSIESTWAIFGLATKLAQSVGFLFCFWLFVAE